MSIQRIDIEMEDDNHNDNNEPTLEELTKSFVRADSNRKKTEAVLKQKQAEEKERSDREFARVLVNVQKCITQAAAQGVLCCHIDPDFFAEVEEKRLKKFLEKSGYATSKRDDGYFSVSWNKGGWGIL